MKIAYFTDMFLPHLSGVTTALINQVVGLSKRGHQIYIFAPKQKTKVPVRFELENVRVEYLSSFPFIVYPDVRFALPLSATAFTKLRKFNPDIVHFQSPSPAGMAGTIVAKILNKPLIGTFHGYFMEPEYLQIVGFMNSFQKITTSVLWKYTTAYFNQCDGVVSPSEISKTDLINHGITRDIHIIHNSINPDQIKLISSHKVQELKQKLGLKKYVVLYVGRISIEKNLDQLITSFQLVLKQQPESSLCIVGKGPATKSLKELARKLRIMKNVIFLGEVQQDPLLSDGY